MEPRGSPRALFYGEEEIPQEHFHTLAATPKEQVRTSPKREKMTLGLNQARDPTGVVETSEQYNRELKAYKKVAQAVEIMGDTIELNHLLEHNEEFKRKYVNLLLAIKWYKSHRRQISPNQPLPRIYLPHEHKVLRNPPYGYVDPNETKAGRMRRNKLSHFPYPYLVEYVPFTESYIDIHKRYNMMSLSTFRDLGENAMKTLRHSCPSPPSDQWINHLPIGTAEGLKVSCKGHLNPTNFLIIDSGLCASKKVILGHPFTTMIDSVVDIISGLLEFSLNGYHRRYHIWRDTSSLKDGTPFRFSLAHFYEDLIWMANEQAKLLGGTMENLSNKEIDKLYKALTQRKEAMEKTIPIIVNSMMMIEESKGAITSWSGNSVNRTQRKWVIYPRNNPNDF